MVFVLCMLDIKWRFPDCARHGYYDTSFLITHKLVGITGELQNGSETWGDREVWIK